MKIPLILYNILMIMKKRILLIGLLILGLFSCKSTDNLITNVSPDGGQINFLRPFSIKTENKEIKNFSMDITTKIKDGTFLTDPVMNYTFTKAVSSNLDIENIRVGIACGDKELYPTTKSLLYKNIAKDKFLEVRQTSTLDKTIFLEMINSNEPLSILIIYTDGTKEVIKSTELESRINNLKIVL